MKQPNYEVYWPSIIVAGTGRKGIPLFQLICDKNGMRFVSEDYTVGISFAGRNYAKTELILHRTCGLLSDRFSYVSALKRERNR